jgi:NhaP-type Na+/H+ or K+/H+ antiporter
MYIGSFVFTTIFGAILIGVAAALFWLYALNRFRESSKGYRWMLTITMIIATYGIASLLGLNEAIAVFVFGIAFATIGTYKDGNESNPAKKKSPLRFFSIGSTSIKYIKDFQREIVFFTSAFFFVYIGMLFNLSQIYLILVLVAIAAALVMIVIRVPFLRLIRKYLSDDEKSRKSEEAIVSFDIPRGLSSAVIATIPLTLGIVIPNFLNLIFIVILVTNVIATIGIFVLYKPKKDNEKIVK